MSSPALSGYRDEFPGEYSWNGFENSSSVCLVIGSGCEMESILDIFGYTVAAISGLSDDEVLDMINDQNLTSDLELSRIIGGLEYDDSGDIISGAVLAGTYSVESLIIIDNNAYIDPSREQWELDVADLILDHDFDDCTVIPFF